VKDARSICFAKPGVAYVVERNTASILFFEIDGSVKLNTQKLNRSCLELELRKRGLPITGNVSALKKLFNDSLEEN
jgi:hypothetical protein